MASRKINPRLKNNPDTGFGAQASQIGGRFINRDGSFNLRKEGWPLLQRVSIYSNLQALSNFHFLLFILVSFVAINILFTGLYLLAGVGELQGLLAKTEWQRIKEVYFFSTETFTTVGYGRINPIGTTAHMISSFESMTGFISFAVLTGLLYGRFSRPKSFIAFTEKALIAPYKEGIGLMFRMVPYKNKHHLTNAQVQVSIAMMLSEGDKPEFKFYQLSLERSRIDTFNMNWTVVHPINEDSPLYNFTMEDLQRSDIEMYVLVSGFDQVFSNTVMQRTSYTADEMVWGARFTPMYRESADGTTTILELNKLDAYEKVDLLQAVNA